MSPTFTRLTPAPTDTTSPEASSPGRSLAVFGGGYAPARCEASGRFTPAQATAAIVVSYYWHFVDVVWIGLFAVIYFIR